MNKLILAGVLSLVTTGAFAADKILGDSSEYYQSPLLDHGPGAKSTMLGPDHGHGDDVISDYTKHGHDGPVMKHPQASTNGNSNTNLHDHGDNAVDNFTQHPHN